MSYLELILLIGERKEKTLKDKAFSIRTNKHLYMRNDQGDWLEQDISINKEIK